MSFFFNQYRVCLHLNKEAVQEYFAASPCTLPPKPSKRKQSPIYFHCCGFYTAPNSLSALYCSKFAIRSARTNHSTSQSHVIRFVSQVTSSNIMYVGICSGFETEQCKFVSIRMCNKVNCFVRPHESSRLSIFTK